MNLPTSVLTTGLAVLLYFPPLVAEKEPLSLSGTDFSTVQMSFLSPNQQCQTIEGNTKHWLHLSAVHTALVHGSCLQPWTQVSKMTPVSTGHIHGCQNMTLCPQPVNSGVQSDAHVHCPCPLLMNTGVILVTRVHRPWTLDTVREQRPVGTCSVYGALLVWSHLSLSTASLPRKGALIPVFQVSDASTLSAY